MYMWNKARRKELFRSKTLFRPRSYLWGMAPTPITEDFYKVLEVEQNATLELITQSYRRLARKLHPDRNSEHDATASFQLVSQLSCTKMIIFDSFHCDLLKSNIKAWTSLRDIEGYKQAQRLWLHIPFYNTKSPPSTNQTNILSAFSFESAIRNTQR